MTARDRAAGGTLAMTRLLAIALVVVTVLPIVVFTTNVTQRRVLAAARDRALQQGDVRRRPESPDARREQVRARRARQHPTAARFAEAMTLQLAMLFAIAVVGRRLFALRL